MTREIFARYNNSLPFTARLPLRGERKRNSGGKSATTIPNSEFRIPNFPNAPIKYKTLAISVRESYYTKETEMLISQQKKEECCVQQLYNTPFFEKVFDFFVNFFSFFLL